MKIETMLIDDEKNIADGFAYTIRENFSSRVSLHVFYDALEALEYSKNHPVSLLISDISMPELDGITLAKKMKEKNKSMRTIFLTGMNSFEYVYNAVQIGNVSYIMKIEEEEKLIKLIDETLTDIASAFAELEKSSDLKNDNTKLKQKIINRNVSDLLLKDSLDAEEFDFNSYLLYVWADKKIEIVKDKVKETLDYIDIINIDANSIFVLLESISEDNLFRFHKIREHIFNVDMIDTTVIYSNKRYLFSDFKKVYEKMKSVLLSSDSLEYLKTIDINTIEVKDNLDFISEVRQFMLDNMENGALLKDASDHFHYNISYFSRTFKSKTGMNYKDYLLSMQIQRAKTLLTSTEFKVQEISKKVGFFSTNNFQMVFKRETGMTPKEYRKQQK